MTAPLPPLVHRVSDAELAAPLPEDDAVARAQRGDTVAFESVYRTHAPRVLAICVRMSGDHARGIELMQDVFVRTWERLASFRNESSFATWLHRLAVNVVLESRRSGARRHARLGEDSYDADPDLARASAHRPSNDERLDQRLDLERAIALLPAGARRAFVLHDMEGFRHAEIARMTGLAEGTVRAQLHRARALLMEALER